MVDLPSTIWRPTNGLGEAGQSDSALITTQNNLILTTQSGVVLQIQPASYTKLNPTEWIESDGE